MSDVFRQNLLIENFKPAQNADMERLFVYLLYQEVKN